MYLLRLPGRAPLLPGFLIFLGQASSWEWPKRRAKTVNRGS